MKKSKVFYICRSESYNIGNAVFTIYKFSRRNMDFLSIVKVGLMFNKDGNFTAQFENTLERYGIKHVDRYHCEHDKMFNIMSNELHLNLIQINDKKIVDFIKEKAAEIWKEKVKDAVEVLRKNKAISK